MIPHFEKDATAVFKVFWNPLPLPVTNTSSQLQEHQLPWFFTLLSMFSNSLERILNAFSDILFVMTVLMFRNLVNNFRQNLRSGEINADQVQLVIV
jgi:hypothetical protein